MDMESISQPTEQSTRDSGGKTSATARENSDGLMEPNSKASMREIKRMVRVSSNGLTAASTWESSRTTEKKGMEQ